MKTVCLFYFRWDALDASTRKRKTHSKQFLFFTWKDGVEDNLTPLKAMNWICGKATRQWFGGAFKRDKTDRQSAAIFAWASADCGFWAVVWRCLRSTVNPIMVIWRNLTFLLLWVVTLDIPQSVTIAENQRQFQVESCVDCELEVLKNCPLIMLQPVMVDLRAPVGPIVRQKSINRLQLDKGTFTNSKGLPMPKDSVHLVVKHGHWQVTLFDNNIIFNFISIYLHDCRTGHLETTPLRKRSKSLAFALWPPHRWKLVRGVECRLCFLYDVRLKVGLGLWFYACFHCAIFV